MKKTAHLLALLTANALLLLSSCKTEVEFDGGQTEPFPVLNAIVCNGDTAISVNLTESRFFLNRHSFNGIDDATVTISCNGAEFPLELSRKGVYTLLKKFGSGDRLSLSAKIPSFGTRLSTNTLEIPEVPEITAAEVVINPDSSKYIHMEFLNPADKEDFYQIRVYKNGSSSEMHLYCYDEWTITFTSDYPSNNYGNRIMFPDTKLSDTCEVNLYFIEFDTGNGDGDTDTDDYTIVLENLSSDLYRYSRDVLNTGSDGGGSSFSEPVQVHSNIRNGLGIFGTKAVCKLKITG